MSLHDKINEELGTLQQELSRLSNYTTEIGKAKQTAQAATSASEQILETGATLVQAYKELKTKSDDLTKVAQDVLYAIKSAQLAERMITIEYQAKAMEGAIQGLYQKMSGIRALLFVLIGLVVVGVVITAVLIRL